ncbi:hypothetical protein L1049_003659 [Liquidambar formosana]|uniref:Transmembrane protein n=1 Tax=Liquidambar formosana TaxID=63359 RepID=A0AAP0RSI2_LIQFO
MIDESEYGIVSWGMKRSALEESNTEPMILAANRTHRRDPFKDFKYYAGGWNIRNRHYWSSVCFTATPLFIIAAIWFLVFGLCLLIISLYYCCRHRQRYGYSRTAYALSLILLIFFTIAAIIGCIVLYTGQGKFHTRTSKTLKYVVKQADAIVKNLTDVSDYLAAAKGICVDGIFLPPDVQSNIDKIGKIVNASTTTLEEKTNTNSVHIQRVLNAVRLALIIVAAVMLLLAFLGFLFSILGMQLLVNIFVTIGWILVTGTFILCGIFLIFHNVMGDTCIAMDQWVQHPRAHTALDDIIPCVDKATAQQTLFEAKDVTFQLVDMVNRLITNVANVDFLPIAGSLYYNQSGPLVPVLCNPFHPDKTDRKCVDGELRFDNAAQEWRNYVCQVSATGKCTTVGRLTPAFYDQITSVVNISYALNRYGPFLTDLQDCTFVRDTFKDIIKNRCPDLRQYSKWIYIGLAMVSSAVMLSLIFWVLYARERRHRAYTKQFVAVSDQVSLEGEKGP